LVRDFIIVLATKEERKKVEEVTRESLYLEKGRLQEKSKETSRQDMGRIRGPYANFPLFRAHLPSKITYKTGITRSVSRVEKSSP
jgi:hypothetical protein